MYSRPNRRNTHHGEIELPRDYSGNAFMPFPDPPVLAGIREENEHKRAQVKENECPCCNECDNAEAEQATLPVCTDRPKLSGLGGLFDGELGLEELLLLGVIFLLFSDSSHRDNELLIALLLILVI
jgi:hypothetical protein